MSGEQLKKAQDRLVSAKRTKKAVDDLAVLLQRRAVKAIQTAASKWAISKFIVEQSFAHLGLLLYAVLAVVGMAYAAGLYGSFGIAVLDFYETQDFLLSAVASLTVLAIGALAVILVIWLLLRTYAAYIKGAAYRQTDDLERSRHWRDEAGSVGFAAVIAPVLAAYIAGAIGAAEIKANTDSKFVHVTLRGESAATALSDAKRMTLLGTTNRYHFLYQCEAADQGTTPEDCEKGKPFIVPKENVAAIVAYDRGDEPSGSTVKANPAEGSIPPHLHHSSPTMVIRYGAESGTPTYVFPFRPLSPLTTESDGITVPDRTREWLNQFYRSLSSCGDVRLTVTGYASRKGFGDPQHQSIWSDLNGDKGQVTERVKRMNCGLANLRALTVVSALFGLTETEYEERGFDALKKAKEALDCSCSGEDTKCLAAKAKKVQQRLLGLCAPEIPLEWPQDGKEIGTSVRVRAWGTPGDAWSWVDSDESRILSRSVHLGLDAQGKGELVCPQFQHYL